MIIRLNISTCPNDTFMFDALVHGKIDCRGYKFELHLADIAELNSEAMRGDVDVTKLSYAAYPHIQEHYQILSSGSALGWGSGPLLVSRKRIYPDEMSDVVVALPGEMTTANKLLDFVYPNVKEKRFYLFSDISEAINSGEVDAGVLIHEERFIYAQKELQLITDLGNEWEKRTSLPIPLGAIVIKRELDDKVKRDINELIAESVRYAFANPQSSALFVRQHAREITDDVIEKHISMFVNDYSEDITDIGRKAICALIDVKPEDFVMTGEF